MQFHVYDKKYTIQFLKFISVSGIGFLIDFAVYYYLTTHIGFPIAYGNMVSAIPAITWVFIFSTRKIFQTNNSKCSLWTKYVIYVVYQFVLLIVVSYLAQLIYNFLLPYISDVWIIGDYLNLLCKCIITPITMTCNFFMMKFLAERI